MPTTTAPSVSPLFAALRAATSPHHERIEKTIDPINCLNTREEYQRLLEQLWGFYQPTEQSLAHTDWNATEIDFAARRKTPWLVADLKQLNVSISGLPAAKHFPQPKSLAEAIGCLYVLEGATLGGQIIGQHLQKIGINAANGGSFYASYGEKIGERWMQFKAAANAYIGEDVEMIRQAVTGAVDTFEKFEQWFATGN